VKYLHQHGPHTFWLDHRLTPAVRAMLCAMVSRSPVGGIRQRYAELVEAVAADLWGDLGSRWLSPPVRSWDDARTSANEHCKQAVKACEWEAEDALCEYPLHPKVQEFFDRNVKLYGHSSVLELTGSPAVFVEGLAWFGAWLLFDSPLVCGQEASTRAMDFSQRAMCMEAGANLELVKLHDDWMEVFRAEVGAWKVELVKPCEFGGLGHEKHPSDHTEGDDCSACKGTGRKYPWMRDPQPFRPAFDRARWALPGTLSTGVAFASHVRERARAIHDAELVAQASGNPEAIALFREVRECYAAAVPGIGALGLREAVYEPGSMIPGHLRAFGDPQGPASAMAQIGRASTRRWTCDVDLVTDGEWPARIETPRIGKGYVDPLLNRLRAAALLRCSLAVARDWHRHRTFYPWTLNVVRGLDSRDPIEIDHHYEPISELGLERTADLCRRSTELYDRFMASGDRYSAMLCLPLGTRVCLTGEAGLRDAVYTFELRRDAAGANFEYREQAAAAIKMMQKPGNFGMPSMVSDEVLDLIGWERKS